MTGAPRYLLPRRTGGSAPVRTGTIIAIITQRRFHGLVLTREF
jgi:hypothetical protein